MYVSTRGGGGVCLGSHYMKHDSCISECTTTTNIGFCSFMLISPLTRVFFFIIIRSVTFTSRIDRCYLLLVNFSDHKSFNLCEWTHWKAFMLFPPFVWELAGKRRSVKKKAGEGRGGTLSLFGNHKSPIQKTLKISKGNFLRIMKNPPNPFSHF